MARQTPTRNRRAQRVNPLTGADPSGRLDVLASRVLERLVGMSGSPLLHDLYRIGKDSLDRDIHRALGPRSLPPAARRAFRLIQRGELGVVGPGPVGTGRGIG